MDIQLLSRWFNKGYSSREMATFLLLSAVMEGTQLSRNPQDIEERWAELHDQVCKHIYLK